MAAVEGALGKLLCRTGAASQADIRVFATSRFRPQNKPTSLWAELPISTTRTHIRSYVRRALEEDEWISPWASPGLAVKVREDTELMDNIADSCAESADGM